MSSSSVPPTSQPSNICTDPNCSPNNQQQNSSGIQINYILVPLLLILILILAILFLRYQGFCAWIFFRAKKTSNEDPIEIRHLDGETQSLPQEEKNSKKPLRLSIISKSDPTKRESSILGSSVPNGTIETNAIVYTGSVPSYQESL